MAKGLINFRTDEENKKRFEYQAHMYERGNLTAWMEKTLRSAAPALSKEQLKWLEKKQAK